MTSPDALPCMYLCKSTPYLSSLLIFDGESVCLCVLWWNAAPMRSKMLMSVHYHAITPWLTGQPLALHPYPPFIILLGGVPSYKCMEPHIDDISPYLFWYLCFNSCNPSSRCLNTNGTYECVCPEGMVAIPNTGLPSICIGQERTDPCCNEVEACKASFTCASSVSHLCAPHATCIANKDPTTNGCKCVCQEPYIGSG